MLKEKTSAIKLLTKYMNKTKYNSFRISLDMYFESDVWILLYNINIYNITEVISYTII